MNAARAAFAANWQVARRRHGRAPREGPGRELGCIGRPRYLTTVVRLPAEIGERLRQAAVKLTALQPGHYVYPTASIHLTILGLADRPGVEEEVGAVIQRHPAFELEVGGLNLTPSTLFAELHPCGSELKALRSDLRSSESREHGPISRWLRRRLAHANLMRFATPVDPGLVAEVGSLREARFGTFEVREVELVRADKVLSTEGTRTLGRFALR